MEIKRRHILVMSSFFQTVGKSTVSILERSWRNLRIGILFRYDKYKFGEKLTKFLGHVIGGVSYAPEEETIRGIRNL